MHSRGINCVIRPPVCPRSENQRIFSTLGIFFYFIFFPIVLNVGKRREGARAIRRRVFLIKYLIYKSIYRGNFTSNPENWFMGSGTWSFCSSISFTCMQIHNLCETKLSFERKVNIPMTMWINLKCLHWIDTRTNSARGWWSAFI